MAKCPFCQKPMRDDGSIVHHGNCSGLEQADINNLQHEVLTTRIKDLEATLRTIQEMLMSDSIEYDDMRNMDTMIRVALHSQSDAGGVE